MLISAAPPSVLPPGDHRFVTSVRKQAARLRNRSDSQLQAMAADLRETLERYEWPATAVPEAFAVAVEAVQRVLHVQLYDVQLIAARALVGRSIAEMQTGEGKTFAAAPAAVVLGLAGHGVHVANPNHYLAQRDFEQLRPVFELLGLTAALLPEQASAAEKLPAYRADITYGTGYEFGFDYLRDQLVRRRGHSERLGQSLMASLQGHMSDERQTMQRGLAACIVDEADNVLIDDASSPLVLAQSSGLPAADGDAIRLSSHCGRAADDSDRLSAVGTAIAGINTCRPSADS